MSFHTLAYNVDIGQVANLDVPAITDDIFTITNSHFLPNADWDIIYAAAMSATINRARIVSPSNRQITLPFIRPVEPAATPGDNPNVADYRRTPFRIKRNEELSIEATSDLAMATESLTVLLGLQQGMEPAPAGNVFSFRGTSVTASVADAWTTIVTTFADTLQEGLYAVVGLEVFGATEVAGRIIFEDQINRPGCVSVAAVASRTAPMFTKGGLGIWGRFRSTALPQIQVLNTAVVAVHTVNLEIMRVG